MVARGLVLPVLVALRDITPGEQLLRDYGAAWWREQRFTEAWGYLRRVRCFGEKGMGVLLGHGAAAEA